MCVSVLVLVVLEYGVVDRMGVVLGDEDELLRGEVVLEVEAGPEDEVGVGVEEGLELVVETEVVEVEEGEEEWELELEGGRLVGKQSTIAVT